MATKIKVCGITNLEDALMVTELGADALGFIFAPSPRNVTPEIVEHIIKSLPPFVTPVGVFKDAPIDTVNRIIEMTGITIVQLHGSESPDYCRNIKKARIIKRIKIDNRVNLQEVIKEMDKYSVSAYLFDPGEGSGFIFDWEMMKGVSGKIIVAGGLNKDNVQKAIRLLKPYGVDVCSGVEKFFGKKDPLKVKEFIMEVKKCF